MNKFIYALKVLILCVIIDYVDLATVSPSINPIINPLTSSPSLTPTLIPSKVPTNIPRTNPSIFPSFPPTFIPSAIPSKIPTTFPSIESSNIPSFGLSSTPSVIPSISFSQRPSYIPTLLPLSEAPTENPTLTSNIFPTICPSVMSTQSPSCVPSNIPSESPTVEPTQTPSSVPTQPTQLPTITPSSVPSTITPSISPTSIPSFEPSSAKPTSGPTTYPAVSLIPTSEPSLYPTYQLDSWAEVTPVNESTYSPRCVHSTTLNGNSTILYLIGGQSFVNEPTSALADVWMLNILSYEWSLLSYPGNAFTARYGHTSVWSGALQSVLTFGGLDGTSYLSDIWQLTVKTGQWNALYPYNSYPSPRAYHSAVYDHKNDFMYVVAGYSLTTGVLSDVWSYDVKQNQWTKLTDGGFPGRYGHSSVFDSEDKYIYTVAGFSNRALSDVWLFNLGNLAKPWSQVVATGAPPARSYAQVVYDDYQDNLYVIGGLSSSNTALSDVWLLTSVSTVTAAWSKLNVLSNNFIGRYQQSTAVTKAGVSYTTGGALSTSGPTVNQTWALKLFVSTTRSPIVSPTSLPSVDPSIVPSALPTVEATSATPSLSIPKFTLTSTPSFSSSRPVILSSIPSSSIASQSVTSQNSSSQTVVIALSVALPLLCLLLLLAALLWYTNKKKFQGENDPTKSNIGSPEASGKSVSGHVNPDVQYPFYKSPSGSHSSKSSDNLQRQGANAGEIQSPSRHLQMFKSFMTASFAQQPSYGILATGVHESIGSSTADLPFPTVPRVNWNDVYIVDSNDSVLGHGNFGIVVRALLKVNPPSSSGNFNESDERAQATTMDIAVKVFSHTSSLLAKEDQDEVLYQAAFMEAEIVINARENMVFKENIIQMIGVAQGTLPLHLCDALRLHESTMTIGLVMRYEGGGSLNNLIHKRDKAVYKLTMIEKLRLLTAVARGLAELHTAGIIHGDVKPDNILLSSDEPPVVKLADFGLSTMRTVSEVVNSTLDHTRSTRGTPTYCAPEMLVNPYDVSNEYQVAKASRSTDMYAFALVAYELLTEEKPFADVHKETLLAVKVHQGIRPPISKIPSDCPPTMIIMIQSCWHGNRYMRDSAVTCYSNLNYEYGLLTNRIYDVYVSYHPNNRPAAELIFHRLSQLGCRVTFPNKWSSAGMFSGGSAPKSIDRVSLDSYSSVAIVDGISSHLGSVNPIGFQSSMYGSPTQSPNRPGLPVSDQLTLMNQHHPLNSGALKQRSVNLTISSETGRSDDSEELSKQEGLMQKSKIVIACLSSDYQSCNQCKAELRKAKHAGSARVIIPCVIDPLFSLPDTDGEIAYLCQLSSTETKIFDIKESTQLERAKDMKSSLDSLDSSEEDMNTAYEFTPVLNEKIIVLHAHVKSLLGQIQEKQKRPSFFKLRTESASKDLPKDKSIQPL